MPIQMPHVDITQLKDGRKTFTKEEWIDVLLRSKLGGMEFYDVNFSYIDRESFEERYVSVPEQGGSNLIPEGMCNPGQVYTVSQGKSGMIGVFRLESQMLPGNGTFKRTGLGADRGAFLRVYFRFYLVNLKGRISLKIFKKHRYRHTELAPGH